ncbi:UbiX family flavin prenyltransferase [Dactylosporangium sp. CA-092794]|uniref:UbiX family flavin prenyltransferase n=1 Tax=Dactylosporangium sp. CA-092794 TaxID=3239929 RepID=UPI003D940440
MTVRLVVGLSGASGVVYGVRLLEVLSEMPEVETHLIISAAARQTLAHETDRKLGDVLALADRTYSFRDIGAAPSSGSFRTAGMIICPCSMRTLSGVALSSDENLLIRAAGVALKERRRLVLVPRETPLHLGHLRLMVQATEMGAIIAPPVPAFYSRPQSVEAIVDHTVHRILDLFDLEPPGDINRWPPAERAAPPAGRWRLDGGPGVNVAFDDETAVVR